MLFLIRKPLFRLLALLFVRQAVRGALADVGKASLAKVTDRITLAPEEKYAWKDPEVESRYLGELVMQYLRELDQVAYVRFASVYRQFQDVHDFVDELKPMLAETHRKAVERSGPWEVSSE